jgi:hypothetical protein
VEEHGATQTLNQWDYIATRVVPFDGRYLLSGAGLHIPRAMTTDLIEELRAAYDECGDWEICLMSEAGPIFIATYLDRFLAPPPLPEVRTTDGDAICVGKLRFKYSPEGRAELERRLNEHPDFESDEAGQYVWHDRDQAEAGGPLLGNIELGANEGRLEALSRPRLERGETLLRSIFPAGITFRPPVYEDIWRAGKRETSPPVRRAPICRRRRCALWSSKSRIATTLIGAMNPFRRWMARRRARPSRLRSGASKSSSC